MLSVTPSSQPVRSPRDGFADRSWIVSALTIAVLIAVCLVAYRPVLEFGFFWEDPFDIRQVESLSLFELFQVSTNNLYYRPLLLTLVRLLKGPNPVYAPLPFYAFNVGTRAAAALLLCGIALQLFKSRSAALASSLIFLLNPISYDSTAKAMSAHQPMLVPALGAVWLYLVGRDKGLRWPIGLALLSGCMALLFHENAILLPLLILSLEAYLLWERRVSRFSPVALTFFVPAILFAGVWLLIPKVEGAVQFNLDFDKALYVSQSMAFPLGRLISQTGGWDLGAEGQALVAVVLALALLIPCYGRARWRALLLSVTWWALASGLMWATLSLEYLWTGSRLLYFPSFAAALAWGGLVSTEEWDWRDALRGLAIGGVVWQSWMTVGSLNRLYGEGSGLMEQIVASGQSNARSLFVNVPDRFEYRAPLFPIGFWGMMLAPVSQELSDFVELSTNVAVETKSLSDFQLLASMLPATPYRVYTRGSDAHATEVMYESILWADQTYLTVYRPDGSLGLESVGNVQCSRVSTGSLGRFGTTSELLSADVAVGDTEVGLELHWLALEPARPTDTIFVHLLGESGTIIAQGDGDSLGNLLPPSAWRVGHEVVDLRSISLGDPLPAGTNRITVGMYNRGDGQRYPVSPAVGTAGEDGALVIWVADLAE
jgi:hypothetical protein